jgi:hypothetical protein
MKLSDFMTVFLPRYSDSGEDFIMASHADRLKQSQCFIQSQKKTTVNTLRPARDGMTCVTCHNPHVSVKETNPNVFNEACQGCHQRNGQNAETILAMHKEKSYSKIANCVSCHMPLSGASDIPHVTVHDHYIRKPVTRREKEKL